jgi:hypothetical protein
MTGVRGLPEGGVPGRHAGENADGLLREIRIRRENSQTGAQLDCLSERHAFENAFSPGLTGNR